MGIILNLNINDYLCVKSITLSLLPLTVILDLPGYDLLPNLLTGSILFKNKFCWYLGESLSMADDLPKYIVLTSPLSLFVPLYSKPFETLTFSQLLVRVKNKREKEQIIHHLKRPWRQVMIQT
jgi:hypothetical protein